MLGYVNRDPEVRYTSEGVRFAFFYIRLLETWKQGGQTRKVARVIPIKVWDPRFIGLAERAKKAEVVYLEGRLALKKRKLLEGGFCQDAEVTIPRGTGMLKFMDLPANAFRVPEVEDTDDEEDDDGQG